MTKSRKRMSQKRVSRRRVSRRRVSRKKSKGVSRKLRYRTKSKKKENNKKTFSQMYAPSSSIHKVRGDTRRRLMEDAPSAAGKAGIYKREEKLRKKWLRSRGGNLETKRLAEMLEGQLEQLLGPGGDLDQEEMMANFLGM